jgi:tRNA(Arg) A34 adenosine deaminase TadA
LIVDETANAAILVPRILRDTTEVASTPEVGGVLDTSCEPCAMCAGTMYWAGFRSVVYALAAEELAGFAGRDFLIPCRELFARADEHVSITGPLAFDEARAVHEGFWTSRGP